MKDLLEFLPYLNARSDYQRDNFDKFLKKVSFSYRVPSIHIAGTNGKGSSANYIASIYQSSGKKVALFTSPYFYEVNEMILINKTPIKDEVIINYINQYKKLFEKYQLSSFEILTFIGLSYFKGEQVDIAVIECGMGGLVDATNIFTPILSIITSVSLEHTMYLGQSIAEIAAHKAGIIKEEVPVLIGSLNLEAESVIKEIAKDNQSPIYKVGTFFNVNHLEDGVSFNYQNYQNLKINNHAEYEIKDASIALEAIDILSNIYPVKEEDIRAGLLNTFMPLRMEILSKSPLIILDGGHNLEAIKLLNEAINKAYNDKNIHIVFSCFQDKNLALMLPELAVLSDDIYLTTFDHVRARKEEDYFLFLEEYHYEEDYQKIIKTLLKDYPNDLILITGSLAFTSLVRKDYMEGAFKDE